MYLINFIFETIIGINFQKEIQLKGNTMEKKLITPRFWILAGMILLAAFARFIPHPPNFAPIASIALFGGAYFNDRRLAYTLPIIAMFLTDLIIGLHDTMLAVYVGFLLIVFIGQVMLKNVKVKNVVLASLAASVSFFVITNFGMWALGTLYPKTAEGLVACFVAAVPFFHYTVIGDLFFAGVMFGLFELAQSKLPVLVKARS